MVSESEVRMAEEAMAQSSERDPREEALAEARALSLALAEVALERGAGQVEIIDVSGKVDYADFVIVMSGRSDRQVAALAKNLEGDIKARTGDRCLSVEGLPQARWVLMDFGDVIVHVFHQDTRGYYDLESLWMDAARVPLPSPAPVP
jgi:ribosome-associated protein